jgi:uncharacterized Tic20 family protein
MSTSQDSKNLALLLWVGTFFFGFIPGLVLYLVKQDDKYVFTQAKESLNWCITAALAYVVASILTIIVIGALLFPVIGLCHLVFCIMGAIATYRGDNFKLPFAVRLIK